MNPNNNDPFFIQRKEELLKSRLIKCVCPNCGNCNNPIGAKFCSECGASLTVISGKMHPGPLFLAYQNDIKKYGYIDVEGNMVIEPQYEKAYVFSNGLARVGEEDKYGFIDMSGRMAIAPEYDYAQDFSDGMAVVRKDNIECYIDLNGTVAFNSRRAFNGPFYDGLAKIYTGTDYRKKHGFIDKTGKYVVKPFECLEMAWRFSEGMAWYRNKIEDGGQFGFIDIKGNTVIEPKYPYACDFSEGLACVQRGWIDKNGTMVIDLGRKLYANDIFHEGLAIVRSLYDKKKGFVDKSGNMVLDCSQYSDVHSFHEGLALVRKEAKTGDKFGYIDKSGDVIIPPMFDYAFDFSNGLAQIMIKQSIGYINKNGDIIYMSHYRL